MILKKVFSGLIGIMIIPVMLLVGSSASNALDLKPISASEKVSQLNLPRVPYAPCPSAFLLPYFSNYPDLAGYMGNTLHWQLNSKNVWQSPSDSETWKIYCIVTSGKAVMDFNANVTPAVTYMADNTRVGWRSVASSPGWTIDFNWNGQVFKIHLK